MKLHQGKKSTPHSFSLPFLIIVLFSLVFQGANSVQAQQRKLDKLLDRADWFFEVENYHAPIPMYEEIQEYPDLLVGDEDVINFKLGYCYMKMGWDNDKALEHFLAYLKNDNEILDAYLYAGQMLQLANRFEEAIAHYAKYAEAVREMNPESLLAFATGDMNIDSMIATCERGISFKNNSDTNIKVENLGDVVNSKYDEYGAILTPDGNSIICTKRLSDNLGGRAADGKNFEDIYLHEVEKTAFYQWMTPDATASIIDEQAMKELWSITSVGFEKGERIGGGVNSKTHDGAIQLTDGGKGMYIYRHGRIYKSTFKNGKWRKPVLRHDFKGVLDPSAFELSMYISEDETKIFFSSDREGGYGGLDIWMSHLQEDNTWSTPVNAGPTVNTTADEDAPRYMEKQGILFFASKGHDSMGGFDLFVSQSEDDLWKQAVNLGMPVNSTGDDTYLIPGLTENSALFSSNRNWGHGSMDLYSVSFPESFGEYYDNWVGLLQPTANAAAEPKPEPKKAEPVAEEMETPAPVEDVEADAEMPKPAVKVADVINEKTTEETEVAEEKVEEKIAESVTNATEVVEAKTSATPSEPNTSPEPTNANDATKGYDPTGTTDFAPLKKAAGFEIQIGAFDGTVYFERFEKIGDYSVRKDGKWNKVYYGSYPTISDAGKDLKRLQGLGFEDAFIVPMGYSVHGSKQK